VDAVLDLEPDFSASLQPDYDMIISSIKNPRLKSILDLEKPRNRRSSGLFLIEGVKEIGHAAAAGYEFKAIVFSKDLIPQDVELAFFNQVDEKIEVTQDVFSKLAIRENSGGMLVVAKMKMHQLSDIRISKNPLLLVLESVEKPGNLGAVLRTADGAGVDAVIVCDPQTDPYNQNVVRSSLGCIFTVPLALASSQEAMEWLRKNKIRVVATHLESSSPYYLEDYTTGTALILGTEATGLTEFWWQGADARVIIPMKGNNDSLNVSNAAAVVVYEAVRQRAMKKN